MNAEAAMTATVILGERCNRTESHYRDGQRSGSKCALHTIQEIHFHNSSDSPHLGKASRGPLLTH
jgi:hypothetical protein